MSLTRSLIGDAKYLLNRSTTRPAQSSLRRAISTAYYALFHCITEPGIIHLLGSSELSRGPLNLAKRSFSHKRLLSVCNQITQYDPSLATRRIEGIGKMAVWFHEFRPSTITSIADLQDYCKAVIDLQDERHKADYDLGARFTKQGTLIFLQQAENGVSKFNNVLRMHPALISNFVSLVLFESKSPS